MSADDETMTVVVSSGGEGEAEFRMSVTTWENAIRKERQEAEAGILLSATGILFVVAGAYLSFKPRRTAIFLISVLLGLALSCGVAALTIPGWIDRLLHPEPYAAQRLIDERGQHE